MIEQLISLDELWTLREKLPMIDARSEDEFAQSQIPYAINMPILTNKERIVVGTLYKEKGSLEATLKGFELVGPRFHEIQKEALERFSNKKIIVYCWRGGMRSQILSWILGMVGFEVYRLQGGYKTYRTYTFDAIRKERKLLVLGGKTGTGKTRLLKELQQRGEQIIDLEGLAHHKGSSFGSIGQPPQPSVEQFENDFAEELRKLSPDLPFWVENESRMIGRTIMPQEFYEQILSSPLINIQKSLEERIELIEEEYAVLPKDQLIQAVLRLKKRLGGLRTTQAIESIEVGNHSDWIANMLLYYDKAYTYDLGKHADGKTIQLDLTGCDMENSIQHLLNAKAQFYGK